MNTNRKTIRLKGYDYSQSGWYFVTVCTENRKRLFGNIINENMVLNECGKMIESIWQSLPKRFPVVLDAFQIMPNHIHMIIHAVGAGFMPARTGGFMPAHGERTTTMMVGAIPMVGMVGATTRVAPTAALGDIIGAFKSLITHEYVMGVKNNGWKPFNQRLFQRNYYEQIIRNEIDLNKIREYIQSNPLMWERDRNNPELDIGVISRSHSRILA